MSDHVWTRAERAAVAAVVDTLQKERAGLPASSRVGEWLDLIREPLAESIPAANTPRTASIPPRTRRRSCAGCWP